MIVVAIIGILAAIALPAYMSSIARAQAAEGMRATKGMQADVGIYFFENNSMPPIGADVMAFALLLEGKYFDAGDVTITPDNGIINVAFRYGANSGNTLTLEPVISASSSQIAGWKCGGLPNKHLPVSCQ